MNLNETQSASVCQAFCTITDLTDAAEKLGINSVCIIDESGDLFFHPTGDYEDMQHPFVSSFLRNVKDRTPKEIDQFKADWTAALEKGIETRRKERIAQLEDELAKLRNQQ
jgi:hypothetical protein